MLTIKIVNDGTGTNETSSYYYVVFVNDKEIARGEVKGHNRADGWVHLLSELTLDAHTKEIE